MIRRLTFAYRRRIDRPMSLRLENFKGIRLRANLGPLRLIQRFDEVSTIQACGKRHHPGLLGLTARERVSFWKMPKRIAVIVDCCFFPLSRANLRWQRLIYMPSLYAPPKVTFVCHPAGYIAINNLKSPQLRAPAPRRAVSQCTVPFQVELHGDLPHRCPTPPYSWLASIANEIVHT